MHEKGQRHLDIFPRISNGLQDVLSVIENRGIHIMISVSIKCTMSLWTNAERSFLEAVGRLAYANPFLPERVQLEKSALGKAFVTVPMFWSSSPSAPEAVNPNLWKISEKLEPLIARSRDRIAVGDLSKEDAMVYESAVHHLLYQRCYPEFIASGQTRWGFYKKFVTDWNFFFQIPGKQFETQWQPAHAFACFWHIQRAFHHIFDGIIGNSLPAAKLRASVWESIFTHDMHRYRRSLYKKMEQFPTLITGPSGSGKEIVARAIAGSRYIAFNANRLSFEEPKEEFFHAINMAALSPALIESELFGHRRGAFTGAVGDRKGYLESCPQLGSVFLDELGELDISLQAKLLRVLETRTFQQVGDVALRKFEGKLIAATNRDLANEIANGTFREDLYYRLCADRIQTPGLAEQLEDRPETLDELALYMARRTAGDEAETLSQDVKAWMARELPANYSWPGNYRELEQCVRNILIRRGYQPLQQFKPVGQDNFYDQMSRGEVTAGQVLSYYSALVYSQCGSYEETAKRLDLDRRTVKRYVNAQLVLQKTKS